MNILNNISTVYFLGIGGIGMSALARYLHHFGLTVRGYDRTPTQLTHTLQAEGIEVHFEDLGAGVATLVDSPEKTLVVYTPAVPVEHNEYRWLNENGYTIWKRAKLLGEICRLYKCAAVAGTHGKTTVSTMIAHIMNQTEEGCGAILGGVSKNFDSNLLLPKKESRWMVTEADEFDRSFLQLTPDLAVITSIDADHLDVYGDYRNLTDSFNAFAAQVKKGGHLLVNAKLKNVVKIPENVKLYTYSLDGDADFTADDLTFDESTHCYRFRLSMPAGFSPYIEMRYPGLINVENAVAAAGAAFLADVDFDSIKSGLETYEGVKRRFDIRYQNGNTVYIDDYAHHPEELNAFISSVRMLYPDRKITGIFQPHLYTRTRDFADGFAASLDLLDTAVLLPVYPAREEPIGGVSSGMIAEKMKLNEKYLIEKNQTFDFIRNRQPEVLLTMGAGDIDMLVDDIVKILKNG